MSSFAVDLSRIITAEDQARARAQAQARATLAATDWLVIRAAETGKPVPEDIRTARAEARTVLSD